MIKTLNNNDVTAIVSYFNNPSNNIINSQFPISFGWKLRKNIVKLSELYQNIEKMLNEIISEYNTDERSHIRDENGTEVRYVNDEFKDEFIQKRVEFMNQMNEINIECISEDEFMNYNIELTMSDLHILSFMIENNE